MRPFLPALVVLSLVAPTAFLIYCFTSGKREKTDGYWLTGAFGPSAIVDFCEPNHQWSFYVSELLNTVTSCYLVFFGVAGAYYVRRFGGIVAGELRLIFPFLSLAGVGVGSALFHGTGLRSAQLLDEVPMLFVVLSLAYNLSELGSPPGKLIRPWLAWLCVLFVVAFIVLYLVVDIYAVFLVSFSSINFYCMVRGGQLYRELSGPRYALLRAMFVTAMVIFFVGFGAWILDNAVCEHIQNSGLHGLWHIAAGLGAHNACVNVQLLRTTYGLRREAALISHDGHIWYNFLLRTFGGGGQRQQEISDKSKRSKGSKGSGSGGGGHGKGGGKSERQASWGNISFDQEMRETADIPEGATGGEPALLPYVYSSPV